MKFPTIVYRTPGQHQCAGGTYSYTAAGNQEQFARLTDEGWFPSLKEAMSADSEPVVSDPKPEPDADVVTPQSWLLDKAKDLGLEVEDSLTADELLFLICHEYAKPAAEGDGDNAGNAGNAQPTREEMEIKAKELGIHFDGRTTDKSLAEKIEHVLSEQE